MNDYLIFGASGLTGNYFLNQVKKEGQKYHLFVRSLIPNEQEITKLHLVLRILMTYLHLKI